MVAIDETALELIIRGYRFWSDPERMESELRLVQEYFESITAEDVNDAIAEFEHSITPAERWAVAKTMIAYFRWCWRNGKTHVGDASLDTLVLSFAKASFVRISGAQLVSGNEDDGELLPEWCSPDIAFGSTKPNFRLSEDNIIRDIAIAMHVESLRRDGVTSGDAKKRAAGKFSVSVPVVAKAITLGNSIGYGRRFTLLSDDDLKREVVDHFESQQEKTTR